MSRNRGSTRKPVVRTPRGGRGGGPGGVKRVTPKPSTPTEAPEVPCSAKHKPVVGEKPNILCNECVIIAIMSDYLFTDRKQRIVVPNVHIGKNESDIVSMDYNGYLHEYEIKTSKADFIREFVTKVAKHRKLEGANGWQRSFTYVAPAGAIPLDLLPPYANLIELTHSKSYAHLRYSTKVTRVVKVRDRSKVRAATRDMLLKLTTSLSRRFVDKYRQGAAHLGGCKLKKGRHG